jgi:quercetin dioxygenase-like cupin family protein
METSTIVEKNTSTESRRAFPGVVFNVLMHGNASDNNIFVAEVAGLPGGEPPRHVHTLEDEVVTVKEGNITYFIGDDIIFAKPGDTVILPKNIPHHFVITSERMKVILVATSASFGDFFCSMSIPYNGKDIPVAQRPSKEKIKEIVALTESFGIYYA